MKRTDQTVAFPLLVKKHSVTEKWTKAVQVFQIYRRRHNEEHYSSFIWTCTPGTWSASLPLLI